jgi:hypothetical protein
MEICVKIISCLLKNEETIVAIIKITTDGSVDEVQITGTCNAYGNHR